MHLTFPPAAAEPLAGLRRVSQLHACAFLAKASDLLTKHPYAPLDDCTAANHCQPPVSSPPRRETTGRHATALCLLCAVDAAVERYSRHVTPAISDEFHAIGTVAKQAALDVIEANPGTETMPAEVTGMVSTRLHTEDLSPRTAAEQAEDAELALCFRWLDHTNYRGAIPSLPPGVEAVLVRRGWMLGGTVTGQGKFAHEQHKRDVRKARDLRRTRAS